MLENNEWNFHLNLRHECRRCTCLVNVKKCLKKKKKSTRLPKCRNWVPTLVVLTLLPVLQDHPVRSGRTLHSSPSMHGCIWHHHFWATMEAEGNSTTENVNQAKSLLAWHEMVPNWLQSTMLAWKRSTDSDIFLQRTHHRLCPWCWFLHPGSPNSLFKPPLSLSSHIFFLFVI